MKFLVLTKRRLITAVSALAACVLVVVLSVQGILAIQASTEEVAQAASKIENCQFIALTARKRKSQFLLMRPGAMSKPRN